ncbi:DUF7701 domain-containing protein [Actinomadura geliboluensis]|uniref:DUF7701 domain-containing protein n=1 Tax=Actinomadura geliboluensis TaxID=882440 RepID=UPI003682BE56
MTYIDEVAALVRDCLPPEARPPEDAAALFRIYAVLTRAKGKATTAEDVHDAWSAWMLTVDPTHPALLPFNALPQATQAQDKPYLEAIHKAASKLAPHHP